MKKSIVAGVRGVVNVMRGLDMLPARKPRASGRSEPYVANSSSWVRAPNDGLFRPLVRLGAHVKVGDALGAVSSPFSSDHEAIRAPFEGIVICINRLPPVNEGEALFHLARFEEVSAVKEEIASHESLLEADPLYRIESIEEPT